MRTPYAVHRPVSNRFLVRERDRRRLRELLRVTLAVLVVGSALLGYTWLHLQLLGSGYRVETLQQRLDGLERYERHLRLEEAYLSSPPRLDAKAREELGLQSPTLDQLVFLEPGGGP